MLSKETKNLRFSTTSLIFTKEASALNLNAEFIVPYAKVSQDDAKPLRTTLLCWKRIGSSPQCLARHWTGRSSLAEQSHCSCYYYSHIPCSLIPESPLTFRLFLTRILRLGVYCTTIGSDQIRDESDQSRGILKLDFSQPSWRECSNVLRGKVAHCTTGFVRC